MERKPLGASSEDESEPAEILVSLFGTTVAEMRDYPTVVKEKFAAVFGEWTRLAAGKDGPSQLNATRELMRRLRQGLQASGENVPEELEELPARIAELFGRFRDATPDELADLLRGVVDLVKPPGGEDAQFDEVAAWFEATVGPLAGFDREKQRQEERLQAEYREAAKRSIGASLRKQGIQPLTTDPEPALSSPKMNRQRLFWKEFAALAEEIKRLLAGGEIEVARKKIADGLDAFDLRLRFDLSLEGDDAILAFPPPDDPEIFLQLQIVIRDCPKLPGWRIVRSRRYGTGRP